MSNTEVLLLILLYSNFFIKIDTIKCGSTATLIMIHTIFRHGNRTTGLEESYPKDPYLNATYYPFGRGQLTNAGKRKEYSVGQSLRTRYNKFLGDYFYPEIIDAVSTDYNRTKMSLELVLASLFPPRKEEVWSNDLNWQPIPYNYLPTNQDKVLNGNLCPHYLKLYNEQINFPQQQAEYMKYEYIFDYISKNSGLNVTTFAEVYNLYFGLSTESEWGFELPEWTQPIWPEIVTNLAVREYFVQTATTELRKMAVGYFFKKLISDTKIKIKGNNRKIYMYSAHESNIAHILNVLDIFDPPHIPTYGSHLIFEVHKIDDIYGFKIYYDNYSTPKPQLMKLPACDYFCPLQKFINLVEEYLPSEDFCENKESKL